MDRITYSLTFYINNLKKKRNTMFDFKKMRKNKINTMKILENALRQKTNTKSFIIYNTTNTQVEKIKKNRIENHSENFSYNWKRNNKFFLFKPFQLRSTFGIAEIELLSLWEILQCDWIIMHVAKNYHYYGQYRKNISL